MKVFFLSVFVLGIICVCYAQDMGSVLNVRGQLLREGPTGRYPAARLAVLLKPGSREAVTGDDGIFYFYKVQPGNYTIEINTKDIHVSYPIQVNKGVESSAFLDIPSITLPQSKNNP
jgi:hypothetical protein